MNEFRGAASNEGECRDMGDGPSSRVTVRTGAGRGNAGRVSRAEPRRHRGAPELRPELRADGRAEMRPAGPGGATVGVGGGRGLSTTSNSTTTEKGVHSRALVPSSSRKASELSIEALYCTRITSHPTDHAEIPDEGERARLINDLSRLIREPLMPETTRTAGLTLIGWLARRMPGEAPHALGVAEARQSERRLRTQQAPPPQRKR